MAISLPPPNLPYPSVSEPHLVAAMRAIEEAWKNLVGHRLPDGAAFSTADYADEDKVTVHLVDIINKALCNSIWPWFTQNMFEMVVRDGKVGNFNSTHLDKMPDMVFRPAVKPPGVDQNYGIFVECKVLGAGKNMGDYVLDGLRRFVIGDYAWCMPHGMMLGYVSSKVSLPMAITKYFAKSRIPADSALCRPKTGLSVPSACSKAKLTNVYSSTHGRAFQVDGNSPGDIEVFHMWLGSPPAPAPGAVTAVVTASCPTPVAP